MKWKYLVALLAVFSLVTAACGDDDEGSSSDSDSGSASTDDGALTTTTDDAMTAESHSLDIDAILAADADAPCADSLSGDPIRVGMAMDFSDVVGFVDIPGSNLVPYVAEKINEGGIGGAPVEVRGRGRGRRCARRCGAARLGRAL